MTVLTEVLIGAISKICDFKSHIFFLVDREKLNSLLHLRGLSQNFEIFFIIGPILLKFSHNM